MDSVPTQPCFPQPQQCSPSHFSHLAIVLGSRGPLMSCALVWNVLPISSPGQSLIVLEHFV